MVWNGLIEITLELNGAEWSQMKHYRFNWMKWIWIEWKVMDPNTVEYNRKGTDWAWTGLKMNICTTLLYHVTPYTLGCIYTVHFLWCSYDECAVNNKSIGFDLESQVIELGTVSGQEDRSQWSATVGNANNSQVKEEEEEKNQCSHREIVWISEYKHWLYKERQLYDQYTTSRVALCFILQ